MTQVLTSLSDALAETVATGGSSVVRVEARDRVPASGIVWPGRGIIVTTHHVVERDDNIKVGLPSGEEVTATLAGRDPTTDLAVLRIEADSLPQPDWADPDDLRVGHLVLALGRSGQSVRATMGIVGALGQAFPAGRWSTPPAESSGILRGLSLTVPTPTVRRIVETILAHGRVQRGYLGIGAQPTPLPEKLARELGQETGLLLVSVEPGSPAARQKREACSWETRLSPWAASRSGAWTTCWRDWEASGLGNRWRFISSGAASPKI